MHDSIPFHSPQISQIGFLGHTDFEKSLPPGVLAWLAALQALPHHDDVHKTLAKVGKIRANKLRAKAKAKATAQTKG
jgi:hypothetical protein